MTILIKIKKCVTFQSVHVLIFGSAVIFRVILHVHFDTVFKDKIGLLGSVSGPKLTTIMNRLVPYLFRHKQNTEGTHSIVKEQDRTRVHMFRSSPKIHSEKDQKWAN